MSGAREQLAVRTEPAEIIHAVIKRFIVFYFKNSFSLCDARTGLLHLDNVRCAPTTYKHRCSSLKASLLVHLYEATSCCLIAGQSDYCHSEPHPHYVGIQTWQGSRWLCYAKTE